MSVSEKKPPLPLVFVVMLLAACGDTPTKPQDMPALKVTDAINIVWTLRSYEIARQAIGLSRYEPFHLIFGSGEYFGDDGCNTKAYLVSAKTIPLFFIDEAGPWPEI